MTSRTFAIAVVIASFGCLAPARAALAQDVVPCPDIAPEAPAAEQALCWAARARAGAEGCAGPADLDCVRRAAAHCQSAALDDPAVASVCFLAPIRLGRHDAALAALDYVRERTPLVERCRAAYEQALAFRVVTNPAGADVTVDGEPYGPAPVEVRLAPRWWQRRIEGRFRGPTRTTTVVVESSRIESAFDRTTCRTTDIVVQGPTPPPIAGGDSPTPDGIESSRLSIPGLVSTVSGSAAVIAGGVMLVLAEVWARELRDLAPGSSWDADHQSQLDRIDPMRIAGGTTLGIGALAVTAGIVLLVLDDGSAPTVRARGSVLEWHF